MLQSLQTLCPVLFHLVKDLKWKYSSLPEAFNPLLTVMWGKSIAPFAQNDGIASNLTNTATSTTNVATSTTNVATNTTNAADTAVSTTFNSEEQDTFCESLCSWPNHPSVHARGTYPQESQTSMQKAWEAA